MPSENEYIRENLIKTYCIIALDSSVILDYVFREEGFKIKVDYLIADIKRLGVSCEILPRVIIEITRKSFFAAEQCVKIIRRCRFLVNKLIKAPLNQVKVKKDIALTFEKTFSGIIEEIERKHFPQIGQKIKELNSARIVETAAVLELKRCLLESEDISIEDFFNVLEDKFQKKYEEFNDSINYLFESINARKIKKDEIPKSTEKLRKILRKKCNVNKPPDLELLGEAISRMYSEKKWYGLISTDYTGIVNNKEVIDRFTLLTVADPLYIFFHLDHKVNLALDPVKVAIKRKIPYQTFTETFIPPGVV